MANLWKALSAGKRCTSGLAWRMTAGALFSLPNLISLSRLALAGIFVAIPDALVRAAIVAAAALSDVLDGWVARRQGLDSRWGALLDPLTDRVFVLVVLLVHLLDGAITPAQIAIVLLRDVATAAGFLVAQMVPWMREFVFQARLPGKLVTAAQLTLLFALVLVPPTVSALVVVTGVLSIWAIADYTRAMWATKPG